MRVLPATLLAFAALAGNACAFMPASPLAAPAAAPKRSVSQSASQPACFGLGGGVRWSFPCRILLRLAGSSINHPPNSRLHATAMTIEVGSKLPLTTSFQVLKDGKPTVR